MGGGPPGRMSGVEVSIERGDVLGAVDRKMNPWRRESEEENSDEDSESE